MRNDYLQSLLKTSCNAVLVLFLLISTTQAHHSFNAHYDGDESVTIEGEVTEFRLTNPHSRIYVKAVIDNQEAIWMVEMGSRNGMVRRGWTKDSLKPGDRVRVTGAPGRREERIMHMEDLTNLSNSDDASIEVVSTTKEQAEYPDFEGTWTRTRGFGTHGNFDEVLPLTEQALAAKEEYDEAADSAIQCVPFGIFRQAMAVYPMEIIQDDDLVIFRYEVWDAVRYAYMDGRERPDEGTRKTPMGYSIGHYEGSTLVIESSFITENVFNERIQIDHSDQLETVERYTRSDDGTSLSLEMTLTDPETFTEPIIVKQHWDLTPDSMLLPYGCVDISGQH
jgi:hypothetical protein